MEIKILFKWMAKFIIFFSLIISYHEGYCNTYYVDFSAGSDLNDGLTKITAWQHCPGDENSTEIPASTVLTGGDKVIFKGGISYIGEINVSSGSSSESRVIYDGNSEEVFGAGRAIIDCAYTYYHGFSASGKSYFTIQGFEIKKNKNTFTSSGVTGSCPDDFVKIDRNNTCQCVSYTGSNSIFDYGMIRIANGCNDVVLNKNVIHETEHWNDYCCLNAEIDGDGSTIAPNGVSSQMGIEIYEMNNNITVSNCEVYAAGRFAIRVYKSSNIYLINNNIGGSDAGNQEGHFSVAFSLTGGSDNIIVKGNRVHDGWQYQGDDTNGRCHAGNWFHLFGNNNNVLEENYDPHGIIIEENYIYSDRDFQCSNGSGLGQFEDDAYDITVRNNLIINPGMQGFSVPEASDVKFLGNTFIFYDPYGTGCIKVLTTALYFGDQLDTAYIRHTIKNNIFIQMNDNSAVSAIYYDNKISPTNMPDSDNNLYYRMNNPGSVIRYEGTNFDLSEWQAYAAANFQNQDANSKSGNPNLVNMPENGTNVSEGDYRLQNSSLLAIDMGSDLSDLLDDFEGKNRPKGEKTDIGAYEFFIAPEGFQIKD